MLSRVRCYQIIYTYPASRNQTMFDNNTNHIRFIHLSSFKTPINGRVLSEESAPLFGRGASICGVAASASSMRKCVKYDIARSYLVF